MRPLTLLLLVVAWLSTAWLSSAGAAPPGAPNAEELLRDADRSRGGLETGITWTVEVESREDGTTTRRAYLVRARGNDALAETIAPPRSKGELLLFNDRSLWFHKPGLRKPMSISTRQRLSGQAANGDIASTNYARDYEGKIVGEEKVGDEEAWRLDLVARAENVTYDRIRYWISKSRRLALRAEFLTVSGEMFKAATFEYGNRVKLGSKELEFVSRMIIEDAENKADVTTLKFSDPRPEEHAPSLFNINNVR